MARESPASTFCLSTVGERISCIHLFTVSICWQRVPYNITLQTYYEDCIAITSATDHLLISSKFQRTDAGSVVFGEKRKVFKLIVSRNTDGVGMPFVSCSFAGTPTAMPFEQELRLHPLRIQNTIHPWPPAQHRPRAFHYSVVTSTHHDPPPPET